MGENWADYMRRVTAGATQAEIAARTGIEQSSISRWRLGRTTPRAEMVVAFARTFDRSPLEALIVAGYLTVDDLDGVIEVETSLSAVASAELFDELRRRFDDLRRQSAGGHRAAPARWPAQWTDPESFRVDDDDAPPAGIEPAT